MREYWYSACQIFSRNAVLEGLVRTRVADLDHAGRLSLMKILLTELILNSEMENEGEDDFIDFYHSTYQNDADSLLELNDYLRSNKSKRSIHWYTKCNGFISRLISETYTCLNTENLIRCRFYIRNLYRELKEVHQEQLLSCFQDDLMVYRGASVSKEALRSL